jgi:hypothetical protein
LRKTGGAECYETNTEVDVLLWEVPPTARKPDAVLHRCIPAGEQPMAQHSYVHVGTSHRDMGPVAVKVSAPFPIEVFWADTEVAPRV